jgi:iron complex outermembrane receptor protein
VADLEALLPSTQLNVNSRGEALFLVRGSSERHLGVELEGVPLTVPWDERSDLSLLPLVGIGEVVAQRGVGSVLDPTNAIGGVIRLGIRRQSIPGSHTRLGFHLGEVSAWGADLLHERRDGDWQTTVAAQIRRRDGFLLPADFHSDLHQGNRRKRLNSDLQQDSLLLALRRSGEGRTRWDLIVQASDGQKGVPPEDHLVDARFWRYPRRDRLLAAIAVEVDSTASSRWSMRALASADWFEQEIRPFDDATYTTPRLTSGSELESDHDRTGLVSLGATHHGRVWSWESRARLRHSRHRESLEVDGPELAYAQDLGSVALESRWHGRGAWRARAGAGFEFSSTPETGDKPARDADLDWSAQLGVERTLSHRSTWHLGLARRPRFASLRELYSGALGRFRVNPSLHPEHQTSLETGASWSPRNWTVMANLFAQHLDGAIERVGVPGTSLRQRVNLDVVLNAGIEFGVLWRPIRGLSLDWQQTLLYSRREVDGDFTGRVEDRPDWLATVAVDYVHPSGLSGRVELTGVGPRRSFDDRLTGSEQRLTPLGSDLRTDLRLSWRTFRTSPWFAGGELFVRVENLFDATTWSQLGLPESGRMLRIGLRTDLRS